MKSLKILTTSMLLAGMLFLTAPVLAGGWAVITLDELPGKIAAGGPLEIGFTVRQHGVTPMDGLTPTVTASRSGATVSGQATARGETGHYVATLTLPEAGEWEWSIQAFTVNQPMPPLSVSEASVASQNRSQTSLPAVLPVLAGILGLASLAAGLLVVLRRKARWAIALILVGLVVSVGSIVSAADQPATEQGSGASLHDPSLSQVEVGRRLFIAKGCIVCHSHAETNQVREFDVDSGPDLTDFAASPDYLRMWLKDPLSVKSNAQMPALGLSPDEIEALIAFLNEK